MNDEAPPRDPNASLTAPPLGGQDVPPTRWPGWLLGGVFVVLAAGITVAGYTLFRHQKADNHRAARTQLASIADLKVAQIQRWYQEHLRDTGHILDAGLVAPVVREFLAAPNAAPARARVQAWMWSLRRHFGYHRLVLLDRGLQRQLALPDRDTAACPVVEERAAEAMRTGRVLVTDLHHGEGGKEVHMGVVVPLAETGAAPIGALVIEILPTSFLYPEIQSWPTPSASGETLLVRREADEAVYLNNLRHRKDTALTLRVPLARREVTAVRAVLGEEGVVEGVDYRGVSVLAALRRVPDTPWFLVAKLDREEVDAPQRRDARTRLLAVGSLILAAGLGVGGLWRHQKVVFIRRELTHRQRSEAAIRVRERQLRSLYSAMTEMLVVHEIVADAAGQAVDYRILDCNPAFERGTGIPRTRAVGALATELFGVAEPPYLETYARVAATGEPAQFEVFFPPMGKYFEISVFSPQRGRFATVSTDITTRKKAETERVLLWRELARKNEELEGMIYVASHDLRAPLVNVQGFSHRLEKACQELAAGQPAKARDPADNPSVADRITKSLRYIRSSAEKMDGLINGLLRVSRLGRIEVVPQTIDMCGLLQRVVATLEIQLQKAGAVMEIKELPPCEGDPQLLDQVFTNLIDNAIKYRAPDRPLQVAVSGWTEGSEVVYCVADTGLGIPREHQGKIWEMFHRLHPEGPTPGEGLGLKIVRRILDRHQGRVWVESQRGEGSRFFVALPGAAARGSPGKEARS